MDPYQLILTIAGLLIPVLIWIHNNHKKTIDNATTHERRLGVLESKFLVNDEVVKHLRESKDDVNSRINKLEETISRMDKNITEILTRISEK